MKKITTFLLILLFCALILPWSGMAEYFDKIAKNLAGNGTGNISGFDNLTLTGNIAGDNTGTLNNFTNFRMDLGLSPPANTAVGYEALHDSVRSLVFSDTTGGGYNAAFGYQAMAATTEGTRNAAFGYQAMVSNLTGNWNTAVGEHALNDMTAGDGNTAVGQGSLLSMTSGNYNTGVGFGALQNHLYNTQNTAVGYKSQYQYTDNSVYNTSVGSASLQMNRSGSYNTAVGQGALFGNEYGSYNTAIGYSAGPSNDNLTGTTAIGYGANDSFAIPTKDYQIVIGGSNGVGSGTTLAETKLHGTVLTGGTFNGGTPITLVTDNTTITRSAYGSKHIVVMNNAATKLITLPEINAYPTSFSDNQVLIGADYTIQVWGAQNIIVRPFTGQTIRLNGATSDQSAGVGVTNDNTAGSQLRFVAYSITGWMTLDRAGTWASE